MGPQSRSEERQQEDFTQDGAPQRIAAPKPSVELRRSKIAHRRVPTDLAREEANDFSEDQNPRFNCEPTNIIFDYALIK